MKRTILLFAIIAMFVINCGDSKIEVQKTLLVADVYPSGGASVDPSIDRIIVFFSSSIDRSSLSSDSFILELVGELDVDTEGAVVKTEISGVSDDNMTVYIDIKGTPLVEGSIYRLTVKDVKSSTGELLARNFYSFFTVKTK